MNRFLNTFSVIPALITLSLCCLSCAPDKGYCQLTGYAQGGTYSVKFNLKGVRTSQMEIQACVDSILTLIDTTLSGYNKGSQLSRLNAGAAVRPNALFKEIFALSRKFYDETGGALDVAAAPLFDIWGFGFTSDKLPSAETVDSVLAVCGMDTIGEDMEPLRPGIRPKLNFNAIAQGYTSDKIAEYLHSIGVKDMLVDIGEIYCEGLNQKGLPWSIGIDRPFDGNMTPGADLDGIWRGDGSGCGVVTSGNYRKYYEKDGRKYSHTIDPRTGYPVNHNLLSATIVAPDATTADAYATYCMVIGLDAAKEFIDSKDDVEGYLIYDDEGIMTEWASSGFKLAGK
ncbi:MAG: FAD:protein FMN transferase [Bacteroidales bacterium]|nr:FAD:protein FMN transferase [Bacteroidales bacterium]